MQTAIDNTQFGHQTPANAKPLWAAVGILGVAVLAMGATMVYQGRGNSTVAVVASAPQAVAASEGPKPAATVLQARSAGSANSTDDLVEKPAVQSVKPAPVPVKKVVKPVLQPAPAPTYQAAVAAPAPAPAPSPVAAVAAPICKNCGSIESVTPIVRTTKRDGPGVGAVAGGVAGAVLGNQVGNGNGRTVATILGAIGGGFAGNAIETNMKKETVYQVGIRMDDGSRRTLEVPQAPLVGSMVTVEGSTIRSSDRALSPAFPAPVQRVSQPSSTF